MKKIATILTVAMLGLMVSCTKEQTTMSPPAGSGELTTVKMSFNVSPMTATKGVSDNHPSKSVATTDNDDANDDANGLVVRYGTDSNGTDDSATDSKVADVTLAQEVKIFNMTVFQFKSDGSKSTGSVYYKASAMQSFLDPINGGYQLPIGLVTGDDCEVYLVANLGDLRSTADRDALFAITNTLPKAKNYKPTKDIGLPMLGVYKGRISAGISIGGIALDRLVAKVIFRYKLTQEQMTAGLEVVGVRLRDVANKYYLNAPTTQADLPTANHPVVTDDHFMDYYPDAGVTSTDFTTVTCYIPENLRGTNTSIGVAGQRTLNSLTGNQLNATYIEMAVTGLTIIDDYGYYYYSSSVTVVDAKFNFLLGDLDRHLGDFNVERNKVYNIDVTVAGGNDGRVVIDETTETVTKVNCDMSNSVIIAPNGGSAIIGIGTLDNGWAKIANMNDADKNALHAKVVWCDVATDIVTPTLDNKTGALTVTSLGTGSGNAVVALCATSTSTEALWSWHVWVTDYDPDAAKLLAGDAVGLNAKWGTIGSSEVHTYGTSFVDANSNKVIMDRNLGAVKAYYAAPTDGAEAEKAWGLLYQWGRKDPMPRGTQGTTVTCYPVAPYSQKDTPVGTAAGTGNSLGYSIKNPLTFITSAVAPVDWYTTVEALQNDHLWATLNGDKGVYDPCPDGWRVLTNVASTWADFKDGAYSWSTLSTSSRSGGLYDIDGGVSTWYGAPGRKQYNGTFAAVGSRGYLWTSTTDGLNAESSLFGTLTDTVTRETRGRSTGISVRCISE